MAHPNRTSLWPALLLALLILPGCGTPPPPPQYVFLVTIDTLRADHLSLYGYPRETSPFIDSLGARGLVFETTFASCSHTAPSHASLFTGLHPVQHRVLQNGEELPEAVLTLAELYQSEGYRTAGFTTVGFVRGLRAGFEEFSSEKRFHPAPEILGKALAWIRERQPEEKLFIWIHLFDVHQWNREEQIDRKAIQNIKKTSPMKGEELLDYLAREHGKTFEQGREKVLQAVNRYDGQILSTDRALEDFFTTVGAEGFGRNALWVVTSDHGEGLGNHNYMGHGKTVYNEQIRVPLLFHFTDGRYAPRRAQGLVRLVDVAATLANVAGKSLDEQVVPPVGRSLLPLFADPGKRWDVRSAFAQRRPADEKRLQQGWTPGDVYSVQTERFKAIVHSAGEGEFYDLENDPFEKHNLIAEPHDEKDAMQEALLRSYRAMLAQGEQLGTGEINPEHIEELKALGYL